MLERLKYFFFNVHNDWQIGIIRSDVNKFLFSNLSQKIKWLKCEFNVYQADPFGIEKDGKLYLFYEEYLKDKEYALLKCSVYDTNLNKTEDRIILDDGTHKSFPFVFEHEYTYFLMPESGALDKLILYEALDFPYNWKEKQIILNFACSDAILKRVQDNWYLFYSKSKVNNENEILYLRVGNNIFCDWNSLKEIIVKKDYKTARNAGDIAEIGEKYYRFSQNCSKHYGESITINEISNFNPLQYKEVSVLEKRLNQKNNGFHTINSTSNFILIDKRMFRFKFKSAKQILNTIKLILKN